MMRKVKQFLFNQNRDTIIFFNVDTKEKNPKILLRNAHKKSLKLFVYQHRS